MKQAIFVLSFLIMYVIFGYETLVIMLLASILYQQTIGFRGNKR